MLNLLALLLVPSRVYTPDLKALRQLYEDLDGVDGDGGNQSVPKVEDVPRCCVSLSTDLKGTSTDLLVAAQQRERIEVALDGAFEPLDGIGHVDSPVEADDIGIGAGDSIEVRASVLLEDDARDSCVGQRGEDAL